MFAHTLLQVASYYSSNPTALALALIRLGFIPADTFSPLACEVCGTTLGYVDTLPTAAPEFVQVPQGNGECVLAWAHQLPNGGKVLGLRFDNPMCAGEATWWGLGTGGQCNCDWQPCPAE